MRSMVWPLAAACVVPASLARAQDEDLAQRVQELEHEVRALREQKEQTELEALMADAEAEAKAPEEETKDQDFYWGALALQRLNPELSVAVDVLAVGVLNPPRYYAGAEDRSGLEVRELAVHFQHALDPFSMFKASLCFSPVEGAALEEAYITWFGVLPSLSLTVGRFRHQFGVINRWHEHDLDQVHYPMALRLVLGEEGLTGNGIAVKWMMPPLVAHANELTLEITDGESDLLFSGQMFTAPAVLARLKNYYDLSESTYLEIGLSGAAGFNSQRAIIENGVFVDEPFRSTIIGAADLTIQWSPPREARYRSLTWRSEGYFVSKQLPGDTYEKSWGIYSYIDYQLATQWFAGVRGDVALPTVRIVDDPAWDVVGYLTFWQSEFVYLRLEYTYGHDVPFVRATGVPGRRVDNRVIFQIDFAAGPHKHEKY